MTIQNKKRPFVKKSKQPVLIINPVSGKGDPATRRTEIVKIARSLGWKGEVVETTLLKSATLLASEAIKIGADKLIVCGGDGTVMEVLPSLIGTNVALGIVPLGTGNLLARNLNIPLDMNEALKLALKGKEERIDVGKANDTFFAVMAGIGLDAEIMRKTNRRMKDIFGIFAYIGTTIQQLGRHSGSYSISVDGGKAKTWRAKTIMIANMGEIQGGVKIVPATHPQNGKLRIGIVQASTWWSWLDLLYHAMTRTIHKSEYYTLLQGKKIKIISLRGKKPYECDGNHFPPTDSLDIAIFPKAISVIVNNNL